VKVGKELALLFSVMFLPGLLTQTGAVDPSSWDAVYYHLTILTIAVPQVFLVVYLTNLRTPGVRSRLGWTAPKMADVVSLFISVVLLVGALSILTLVAALFPDNSALWEPGVQWSLSRYELVPLVIVSSIAIGYREEIFYRAYLYVRGEELGLHPIAIVGGSTVLFAVGHLYQGWAGFITAFLIGAILGVMFAWRRSLHGIAIAHGLYNAMVLVVSLQGQAGVV
jgi:CAAX protease family protein